jgi:hypothetical protein
MPYLSLSYHNRKEGSQYKRTKMVIFKKNALSQGPIEERKGLETGFIALNATSNLMFLEGRGQQRSGPWQLWKRGYQ